MKKKINASCGCETHENLNTKLQLKTSPAALLETRALSEVELAAIEDDLGKLAVELEQACAEKQTEHVAFLQEILKLYEARVVSNFKAKKDDFRKDVVGSLRRIG